MEHESQSVGFFAFLRDDPAASLVAGPRVAGANASVALVPFVRAFPQRAALKVRREGSLSSMRELSMISYVSSIGAVKSAAEMNCYFCAIRAVIRLCSVRRTLRAGQ